MTLPIIFIMCTEGGQLEQESLLMVESFRQYAGRFNKCPLYSFQVRENNNVSSKTIATLKDFNVDHQKLVLNTKYPNYPLANKPLLCAHIEQTVDSEIIVFLDSDLVFFNEPHEFLLPSEYDVGIRPEHHKMIGSEGRSDPNEDYWMNLYNIAGIAACDQFVTTTVDQKNIRAFWNSGVVAMRRSAGIFSTWKQNIEKLIEAGTGINQKNFYYEQSALSATICAKTNKIFKFSPGYNYPIHSHNKMPDFERLSGFDQIICIHDHLFRARKEKYRERTWVKTLKCMKEFDQSSEKYQWLYRYLSEHTPKPNLVQQTLERALFFPGIKQLVPYNR